MPQVNNYNYGVYDTNEVYIQTESRQLDSNNGKVYLRKCDLVALIQLLEDDEAGDTMGNLSVSILQKERIAELERKVARLQRAKAAFNAHKNSGGW
jgi:hypothetical protein